MWSAVCGVVGNQVTDSQPRRAAFPEDQDDRRPCSIRDMCRFVKPGIIGRMKIIRNIVVVMALASVALATSACPEKKGPLEKAGEKADEAIDKAKDAVK